MATKKTVARKKPGANLKRKPNATPAMGKAIAKGQKQAKERRKAKEAEAAPAKQTAKRTKDKSIPEVPRGAGAEVKSKLLLDYAQKNGWWAQLKKEGKDDIIRLVCKRAEAGHNDMITSEWIGGRIPLGGLVFVLEDGRSIRLRNISHALHALNGSWQPKRDAAPRRVRAAKPKTSLRVMEDGTVERVEVERTHAPVGAHIIDKWYHLEVTKPLVTGKGAKRKVTTKVVLRMGPVLRPTADKFVAEAERDGENARLIEHIMGSCEVCAASAKENPVPPAKGKPVKQAAVAKAKPKRKKAVA